MKNDRPWSWRPIKVDTFKNKVTAVIESVDLKSQLKLDDVNPELVETVTSLLTSSYRWGATEEAEEAEEHLSVDSSSTEITSTVDEEVARLRSKLEATELELRESKDKAKSSAQAVGALKGQLTKLKAKYEAPAENGAASEEE